jgi:hypothetical protein
VKLALVFALCCTAPLIAQRERFPTEKSVELKDEGRSWFVDGHSKLPSGISVANHRSTIIEGIGAENVIELSGSLALKASLGGKVVLKNIWIEVEPDAQELYLSQVDFQGGGIRTTPNGTTAPKVFAEFTTFDASASVSLRMCAGEVDLQQCKFGGTVTLVGIPQSEKAANKTDIGLLDCNGLPGGLVCQGIATVQVRGCNLGGAITRITNWTALDFDGNNAHSTVFEFELPSYGKFKTAKIHNSDFRTTQIAFKCPADDGKAEKWTLEHCYFGGLVDPKTIASTLIADHATDAKIGVEVQLKRIAPNALGLGG